MMVHYTKEASMEDEFSSELSSPFIVPCVSYSSPASTKTNTARKDKKLSSSLADKQRKRIPLGKPAAEETLGLVGLPILDNSSGSSNSLSPSPSKRRTNKNATSRPRAKTFSHSSTLIWDSPMSCDSAEKPRLKRDKKSISVLCDLFQQQQHGGRFDSSPVVSRVRHSNGLPTMQTSTFLPFVEGSSPSMHHRQLDLAKSPYRVPLAPQGRKTHTLPGRFSSPGFLRKQQTRNAIPGTKAATLPRLNKISPHVESSRAKKQLFYPPVPPGKRALGRIDCYNLQKSSSSDCQSTPPSSSTASTVVTASESHCDKSQNTLECEEDTLAAELKKMTTKHSSGRIEAEIESLDSSSTAEIRGSRPLDIVIGSESVVSVIDVDCAASRQDSNPTSLPGKSGSPNASGSNVTATTGSAQSLTLPSILVRSATPCDSGISEEEQKESGQELVQQFVMRAELAEELNKLYRDVQDIVETNKSILESNDLDSSEP